MSRSLSPTPPSTASPTTDADLKKTATRTSLVSGLAFAVAGSGGVSLLVWGLSWIGASLVVVGGMVWVLAQLAKKGLAEAHPSPNGSPPSSHLHQSMTRCRYLEHVGPYGEQTAKQFESLQERRRLLADLLNRKFQPGELTHGRYMMATEQAFLSMCDNLSELATALQSVDAIDPVVIEPRIRALETAGGEAAHHEQELRNLRERLNLRQTQLTHIATRLGANEETLTQLDRMVTALSSLRDQSSHAELDLETSLEELKRLIARVDTYRQT